MSVTKKVDVLIALFSYAGNGGVSAILPEIGLWLVDTTARMREDPRVGRVGIKRYGDVPLTMERNRVVKNAKDELFDVIVMIDSDNQPDGYLGKRPWAKSFWQSSFDFAFERLMRGIPTVVVSPYCGPSPHPTQGGFENVYVFYCEDDQTGSEKPGLRFTAYSRGHAAQMRGIQEIAAGPTGVSLFTTDAFDLMPIDRRPPSEILADLLVGKLTPIEAERKLKMQSWFFYEFTDGFQTQKGSTEDITSTREIQMAGLVKFKQPVVFCNWDAWALHAKPRYVGMPEPVRMESVSAVFQEGVLANIRADEEIRDVDFTANEPLRAITAERSKDGSLMVTSRPPQIVPVDSKNDALSPDNLREYEPNAGLVDDDSDAAPVVPIKARMICGRKVKTVGHETHLAELEALTKVASMVAKTRDGRPLKMLEVGSWVGESAIALLGGAPKDSTIYCVDTWEGTPSDRTGRIAAAVDVWKYFKENVGSLLGETVRPIRGMSAEIAQSFQDAQELDLVFIDAEHTEAAARSDIDSWYRHVSIGGLICGHDFCEAFPGVIAAVTKWLAEFRLQPTVLPGTSIWFVTKATVEHARAMLTATQAGGPANVRTAVA